MVLFGHAAHYFIPGSILAQGTMQGLGVYLFFLISGFLISYSVFQKHADERYGFRSYFIDRFCRIYSAMLPALFLVLLLDAIDFRMPGYAWGRDFTPLSFLGNVAMLQDFPVFQILRRLGFADHSWFIGPFGSARPLWTISIEWWIYMTFGGIALVMLRRYARLGVVGALLLAFAAIEPAYHLIGGYDECLTLLWLAGMGASFLWLRLPALVAARPGLTTARLGRIALLAAAAGLVAAVGRLFAVRPLTLDLQFGLFLAVVVFAPFFALGLVSRELRWLGRGIGFVAGYSYSLYLTHHSLVDFLALHDPRRGHDLAGFWLAVVCANLIAIAFWYVFERHHRALAAFAKRRFAKGRPQLEPMPVSGGLRR